jgi:hypothetical protein
MREKRSFAIQSLIIVLIVNAVLLGAIGWLAGDALQASGLSAQLHLILGIAVVGTLLVWFVGSRAIDSVVDREGAAPAAEAIEQQAPPPPAEQAKPAEPPLATANAAAAVQMLSLLQREGRLVDFLEEDLSTYDDAQIGAAVRNVHAGCKQTLSEYVTLKPIFDEREGNQVTVPAGFDANAIRLTGNVVGDPPFKGVLRHRGWRVVAIDLPKQLQRRDGESIVAAAEIEVGA